MKLNNLKLAIFSLLLIMAACNKEAVKQNSIKSTANASEATLASNLVAWYTFDGDVLDHSGNGNDVVFNNATPATGKNGGLNTAYKFDGHSTFMRVANSASLQGVAKKGITMVAVFKVNGFFAQSCHQNRIFQKGYDDQSNGSYFLGFDDGEYYNYNECGQPVQTEFEKFYGTAGNGQGNTSGSRSTDYVQKNKWYVLVYSCDGNTKHSKLYVNGRLAVSENDNSSATYASNFSDLFIGRTESSQYPYWFNGVIDEIRIYNKTLSDDEAQLVSKNLGAQ